MGLREKAIHASKWSIGFSVIAQVAQLFFSAIMARLLMPQDFGVYGMAFVFIAFLQLFSQLGMGVALVQKKELDEAIISSVFWLNIMTGIVLCAIFSLSADIIAAFFHQPVLKPMIRLLSINFIIVSFSMVQSTLLTREMRFKKIAVVGLVSLICSGCLGIWLALLGFGVWSLVWSTLIGNVITVVLMWCKSEWTPRLVFSLSTIREMFAFGLHTLGFNVINYFSRNIQDVLIGRFIDSAALGYYSMANRVMLLPLQHITWRVSSVAFPALSKIQHDKEAVRGAYSKMLLLISMVTFPIMIGLAAVAPELIAVVFGDKWKPAIIVIQILCAAGLVQSIGSSAGSIMLSRGRADLLFKLGVFSTPIYCVAIAAGLRWGINGVAVFYTLATTFLMPIALCFASSLIKLRAQPFLRLLVPAASSALMMLICLLVFRYVSVSMMRMPDVVFLLVSSLLGATVYISVLKFVFPGEFEEMVSVVKIAIFK